MIYRRGLNKHKGPGRKGGQARRFHRSTSIQACVIAGLFPPTGLDIDTCSLDRLRKRWAYKQVIHAQAGAAIVAAATGEVPIGVYALAWVDPANRIHQPRSSMRA